MAKATEGAENTEAMFCRVAVNPMVRPLAAGVQNPKDTSFPIRIVCSNQELESHLPGFDKR